MQRRALLSMTPSIPLTLIRECFPNLAGDTALIPRPGHPCRQTDEAQTASLESCSCVAIDGTAIYAVQMQQDMQSGHHVHDVLIWDFAKAAKERW